MKSSIRAIAHLLVAKRNLTVSSFQVIYYGKCIITILIVTLVWPCQMAPLSVFKELIDNTKFKIGEIESKLVSVKLSESNTEKFPLPECRACKENFTRSKVIDSASKINWGFLNATTSNLMMENEVSFVNLWYNYVNNFLKDPCFYELMTSVRAAMHLGFQNGHAKTISANLVSLARRFLCPKHTLRLNV